MSSMMGWVISPQKGKPCCCISLLRITAKCLGLDRLKNFLDTKSGSRGHTYPASDEHALRRKRRTGASAFQSRPLSSAKKLVDSSRPEAHVSDLWSSCERCERH